MCPCPFLFTGARGLPTKLIAGDCVCVGGGERSDGEVVGGWGVAGVCVGVFFVGYVGVFWRMWK